MNQATTLTSVTGQLRIGAALIRLFWVRLVLTLVAVFVAALAVNSYRVMVYSELQSVKSEQGSVLNSEVVATNRAENERAASHAVFERVCSAPTCVGLGTSTPASASTQTAGR
jgi:hypothetical protein